MPVSLPNRHQFRMEDHSQSQIYSPENADSQNLSPSDPMNHPPPPHRLIDFLTEPTPQLPADAERDYKRYCKMANGFVPVLLTISFALIVTIPSPMDPDWVILHATDHALTFTSLISCFGLFFYYLGRQPSTELAKVQGTVMSFSAVLLVLSALSRLALLFPCQLLLAMMAIVVMLIGLLFLLLHFI